jgi:hypothetical protein
MLAEILLTLATPAKTAMRRSGHLRAAVALWTRAHRAGDAWGPHEAACHAAVERVLAGRQHGKRVVVLGSGLVLDIPLQSLQAGFEEVMLVDAIHLLPVRLQALLWPRTRLLTADLTAPPGGALGSWLAGLGADLIISANVLSQLPLSGRHAEPRTLIRAHLDGLRGCGAPVLLLTDTDERRMDRQGRVLERLDLLHGETLPAPETEWDWLLAPFGEVAADECLVHRVGAWIIRP